MVLFVISGMLVSAAIFAFYYMSIPNPKKGSSDFSGNEVSSGSIRQPTSKISPQSAKFPSSVGPPPVRVELLELLKGGASIPHSRRFELIQSLVGELTLQERAGIYAFILNDENSESSLQLKNDLVALLVRQKPDPEELCSELLGIYYDFSISEKIRCIPVRHLADCYKNARDVEKDHIRQILDEAVQYHSSQISGVAIQSLAKLLVEQDGFSKKKIVNAAAAILKSKSPSPDSLASTLDACAKADMKELLPLVRTAAETGAGAVKLSAISALGALGDLEDRILLVKLSESKSKEISQRARKALDDLRKTGARKIHSS